MQFAGDLVGTTGWLKKAGHITMYGVLGNAITEIPT